MFKDTLQYKEVHPTLNTGINISLLTKGSNKIDFLAS